MTCSKTGSVNFDHLVKGMSVKLLHCKVISCVISKYFIGGTLRVFNTFFFLSNVQLTHLLKSLCIHGIPLFLCSICSRFDQWKALHTDFFVVFLVPIILWALHFSFWHLGLSLPQLWNPSFLWGAWFLFSRD